MANERVVQGSIWDGGVIPLNKIKKLEIKIRKSDGYGIFHDSRGDVNKLAEAINMMIEKQNEIIDVVNKLIAEKQ